MGKQYSEISYRLKKFIQNQKIFFVGTATADSKINISPKGMDSLRVVNKNRVVWLNVTGSGNETSAHVQEDSRMTLMFTAFEGSAMILRLYGKAKVIHKNDPEWDELLALFPTTPGTRQIFDLDVDLVQASCGMSVPFFDYIEEREQLNNWIKKKSKNKLNEYWEEKNQFSLDGIATNIVSKNR